MAKPYNETGFSGRKPSDSVCQNLLNYVKPLVEIETGQSFKNFSCAEYMDKLTYGTNYKIKVATDKSYLHLHLYTTPQGVPQINFIESNRQKEDDLAVPFDLRNITNSSKQEANLSYFTH